MLKYKLTTQEYDVFNIHQFKEPSNNDGFFYYNTPELAILLNPVYTKIKNPKLWECRVKGKRISNNLIGTCSGITILKEIPKPEFKSRQLVEICYKLVNEIFECMKFDEKQDKFLIKNIKNILNLIHNWLTKNKELSKKHFNTSLLSIKFDHGDKFYDVRHMVYCLGHLTYYADMDFDIVEYADVYDYVCYFIENFFTFTKLDTKKLSLIIEKAI